MQIKKIQGVKIGCATREEARKLAKIVGGKVEKKVTYGKPWRVVA